MRLQHFVASSLLSLFALPTLVCVADDRVPFPVNWAGIGESAWDLSSYLDAPAGKHGFIRAAGEHLVDGEGNRIRLWGVNFGGTNPFLDHEQADLLAETLARLGINCVRIHGIDSDWGRSVIDRSGDDTSSLDLDNLDRFDYLAAQLIRRGIYISLPLNVFRTYAAGDGLPDVEDLGYGKWATHFHPRMIALQEKFARDLLTHVNPYTKRPYTDEPGIVVTEIVNENSLLEGWMSGKLDGQGSGGGTWRPIPAAYAAELNAQLNRFLQQKYSAETLAAFREQSGVDAGAPLVLLSPDQFKNASAERLRADYQFIVSTERSFLEGMKSLIRNELGLKSMLIGDADHNDSINAYPHIVNNATFDYLDGHGYWQHPSIGDVTRTRNDPMVNDPSDSTVVQFARTPMVGKPFVISETQHPYPHRYAAEGIPIVTAYAMLQDWDGVLFHEWGSTDWNQTGDSTSAKIGQYGWFNLNHDPLKLAELVASGLAWHRRDVDPAKNLIVRNMKESDFLKDVRDRNNMWKRRPFFLDSYDRRLPLVSRTRWQLSQEPMSAPGVAIEDDSIVADTGQLKWHGHREQFGQVTVDTEFTQALIGFSGVARGERHPGTRHLGSTVSSEFSVIMLSSLDESPIRESKRLLLTVTDRAADKGLSWEDDFQTVADSGSGPVVIRPVVGKLQVRDVAWKTPTVTVLDSIGRPTQKTWPVETYGNEHWIDLSASAGLQAIIECQ